MPGKPNPPPCAIGGTIWGMYTEDFKSENLGLQFTDPLGCLVPGMPLYPINYWVQVPS